jgi:mycofactocin precursor
MALGVTTVPAIPLDRQRSAPMAETTNQPESETPAAELVPAEEELVEESLVEEVSIDGMCGVY